MNRKLAALAAIPAVAAVIWGAAPSAQATTNDPACTLTSDGAGTFTETLTNLKVLTGTNKYYIPVLNSPAGHQYLLAGYPGGLWQPAATTATIMFSVNDGPGTYTANLWYSVHQGNDNYNTTELSTTCSTQF